MSGSVRMPLGTGHQSIVEVASIGGPERPGTFADATRPMRTR
jgi:hypothetical protein